MAQDEDPGNEFESVYNDEGREELVKDDEISPEEEAFMAGYDAEPEEKNDDDDDEEYEKAFEETDSKKKK
ncbi:MAG: hypothetical protein ABH828_02230 [archaeon]